LGVKRSGREADKSPPFTAVAKYMWYYASGPQFFMVWYLVKQGYVFMAWYLVKQRMSSWHGT